MKLEVVAVRVPDVDRAKDLYQSLGWRLDADFVIGPDFRVIRMNPARLGLRDHFRHRDRLGRGRFGAGPHHPPAGPRDIRAGGIRLPDRPGATAAFTKEHTVRADIMPGGIFPDYELTDHTKTRRRLSELQGIDPMILVLSRGGFCPKDHQQHLELAANYPKIRVAYTQIVTISTDNILKTNEFRDSVGAQWTFLSDAGRKIQKDLDIQEYTDSYYDPMIPYTLVLKPGLVIFSVYNGYWFWGRPSFEDLRRDLREVTREIRPDWDLAAPGLRENWQAGDHSMHHPYQQADHMRTVTPLSVQKN